MQSSASLEEARILNLEASIRPIFLLKLLVLNENSELLLQLFAATDITDLETHAIDDYCFPTLLEEAREKRKKNVGNMQIAKLLYF